MASEWVKTVCGEVTGEELLRRAEKVDREVPGALDLMTNVLLGNYTEDEAVCAAMIGLMESSLNKTTELCTKMTRITEKEDKIVAVRKLAKIRELFDAILEL
jgi:hypothetical protein